MYVDSCVMRTCRNVYIYSINAYKLACVELNWTEILSTVILRICAAWKENLQAR